MDIVIPFVSPYFTVFSEDAEGDFPGWWSVWSQSANGTDTYWDDAFYRPHGGYNPAPWPPPYGNSGWSIYCADVGSARVNPPGPYPDYMEGWMVYGPFCLKGVASAKMEFYHWYKTESDYDYCDVMASGDGTHFYGVGLTGDSGGWQKGTFDLSGYAGDDSVWVMFRFTSDYSNNDEGAYVDDITIRKDFGWRGEQTRIYLGDYDGNLSSDLGLFHPRGSWSVKNTKGQDLVNSYGYGQAGDIPVMGDYDGDGEMDIALFRPSTGVWYARNRSGANLPGFPYCFGTAGDIPVPGDYDGDGKTDPRRRPPIDLSAVPEPLQYVRLGPA